MKDKETSIADLLKAGLFGSINPLLAMLIAPQGMRPPDPSLALPDEHIQYMGKYMLGQQMNAPDTAPDYQWEVNDPSGRLGRMLTDEERRALMRLLQRRITDE